MLTHKNDFKLWVYFLPFIMHPIFYIMRSSLGFTFPYYFGFDSSLDYTIDTLLINGNMMPQHLLHPNLFPLYFEKFIVFPIARLLNIVSISTIQEYANSSNPYLNFVDVVNFLLQLRTSYLYLGALMIYLSLVELCEKELENISVAYQIFWVFSAFIVAFSLPNIIIQTVVRYENMAFLAWSFALFFTVKALRNNSLIYIFLFGLFSGMAFLSKVVIIANILFLVLVYIMFTFNNKEYHQKTQTNNSLIRYLNIANLIFVCSIIVLLAYLLLTKTLINSAYATIFRTYKIIFPLLVLPSGIFFISILQFLAKRYSYENIATSYSNRITIFITGLLIPLLPALMLSYRSHILVTSYAFSFGLLQSITDLGSRSFISNMVYIFGAIIFIGSICLFFKFSKKYYCFILASILVSCTFFINIKILRVDDIYFRSDVMLSYYNYALAVIFAIVYIIINTSFHKLKKLCVLIIFVLSIGYGVFSIKSVQNINKHTGLLGTNFHNPFWWKYRRPPIYKDTIEKSYPTEKFWEQVFFWSRNIYNVKGLLRSVKGGYNVTLQQTSIAFSNNTLSNGSTLKNLSPRLHGALVLPLPQQKHIINPRRDFDFYFVSTEKLPIDFHVDNFILTDLVVSTDKNDKMYVYHFKDIDTQPPWVANKYDITASDKERYFFIADRYAMSLGQ